MSLMITIMMMQGKAIQFITKRSLSSKRERNERNQNNLITSFLRTTITMTTTTIIISLISTVTNQSRNECYRDSIHRIIIIELNETISNHRTTIVGNCARRQRCMHLHRRRSLVVNRHNATPRSPIRHRLRRFHHVTTTTIIIINSIHLSCCRRYLHVRVSVSSISMRATTITMS